MPRGRAAAELVTRWLAAAELFVGSIKRRERLSMTLGMACLGAARTTEERLLCASIQRSSGIANPSWPGPESV